jgi:hypothetical protein
MDNLTSSIVPKEHLGSFKFPKMDVLNDNFHKKLRSFTLRKAESLGNLYKSKVKIWFKTECQQEEKVVDTTVWAYTGDYISLKGGRHLPVKAITRIEF